MIGGFQEGSRSIWENRSSGILYVVWPERHGLPAMSKDDAKPPELPRRHKPSTCTSIFRLTRRAHLERIDHANPDYAFIGVAAVLHRRMLLATDCRPGCGLQQSPGACLEVVVRRRRGVGNG